MRNVSPVVLPQASLVVRRQTKLGEGRCIRSQLVGHDDSRCKALLLEKLAHQLQGRRFVASALHDDVEDLSLAVHGAPEIHPLAGNPHHLLVQMPMGCWFWPTLSKARAMAGPNFSIHRRMLS